MKNSYKKIIRNPIVITLLIVFIIIAGSLSAWITHNIYINMVKASKPENGEMSYPTYPELPKNLQSIEQIKRGEYLAKMGNCISCHTNTKEKGKPFAGGLAMQTPFGKMYTPNITPDRENGIGNWNDEQFIKAMREGIAPDGKYYYPAFPYLYFNRMPVEDIKAIKAYLDHVPAEKNPNHDNEMVWPFNIRFLQLPWRLMFFHPKKTDVFSGDLKTPLQFGEYMVEGPGHCGMCHTPSWSLFIKDLPLGAPIKKYNLAGAKVQGYLAPNINQANFSNTPIDKIVNVFIADKLTGGGNVIGPMLEVNHNSLSYLKRSDLEGIADYLKSVKSEEPPKPTGSNAGKGLYENYCSGCHTTGAGGAPKFGDASSWSPYMKNDMATIYANAIKGINGMPAKGGCVSCTDDEVKQAVDYIVSPVLGAANSATPLPAPVKKLTLEDGKKVYAENCSVCHANGFKGAPKPGDVAGFRSANKAGFLETYKNVVTGKNGHPVDGACPNCSNEELIAAIKYMLDGSAPNKNYSLW